MADAFKKIGFMVTDATYGCYGYESPMPGFDPGNSMGGPRLQLQDGMYFRCLALTDLDDDDMFAFHSKKGTYNSTLGTFEGGGHVYKMPEPMGDDW